MKRAIASLEMPDVEPATPPTKPPVFMMVRPAELLVDEDYQRGLSDGSKKLIRRIVGEWDWRKFKAPVVAMTEDGPVVLDGQHTATAAASHPMIGEIPVLVVEAPERVDQAQAFVGINTTRLGVTPEQLHHANVAAGDPAAVAIDRVCGQAGITVVRHRPSRAVYPPRATIAVAAIGAMIARHGEDIAYAALSILAGLDYGPVQASQIRAVEQLLTDPEFDELDSTDLGRVIATVGLEASEKEAKAFAATHCVPLWKALAAVWFKGRKARRKQVAATREEAVEAAPSSAASGAASGLRPARGGWKPGPHLRRCERCDGRFTGDRQAYVCEGCAYGTGQ